MVVLVSYGNIKYYDGIENFYGLHKLTFHPIWNYQKKGSRMH
jgi:hypothetical protein